MKLIKVDATTSTNELSKTLNTKDVSENFCVSAEFQLKGRGQQNTTWQSNRSENLMFTVVYNGLNLDINKRFCLNALVCLSLYGVLKNFNFKTLRLKWPNDILADGRKICGILIENSIGNAQIKQSYVGVGLNVNQTNFDNLPKASSIKKLKGCSVDKDLLLSQILKELAELPKEIQKNSTLNIVNIYKRYLYGFNAHSNFQLPNSDLKKGKIRDVGSDGQLLVEFESGELQHFEHKAIKQLF